MEDALSVLPVVQNGVGFHAEFHGPPLFRLQKLVTRESYVQVQYAALLRTIEGTLRTSVV